MFNTLYLLNYNNYYNRIFKREDSLTEYLNYEVATVRDYNFNPNDHVAAKIVVNIDDDISPDYVVVIDDTNTIVSRWFVVENSRVRGGQYNLSLYRDTMVDFYDVITESPCFIEKATIPDSDSAIFNSENMTFNRIKTKETPIKDETNTSWLVAYVARDDSSSLSGEITPPNAVDITADRDSWEFSSYISGEQTLKGNITNSSFLINFKQYSDENYLQVYFNKASSASALNTSYSRVSRSTYVIADRAVEMTDSYFDDMYKDTYDEILNYLPTAAGLSIDSASLVNSFLGLDNATIRFTGETQIYRIQISERKQLKSVPSSPSATVTNGDVIYSFIQPKWNYILPYANPQNIVGNVGRFYGYSFYYSEYTMTLIPVSTIDSTIEYNIPIARTHLEDAPYDMICAPYDNINILTAADTVVESSTATVMAVFNDIARKYAGGENPIIYDVQRLPYCPVTALYSVNGVIQATSWNESTQMFPITNGTSNIGVIFACKDSNFKRWIPLEEPVAIDNKKIQTECDMYRICSPNYNGVFEFDPMMNDGLIGFNVYCTYKPFNPYIQVSPNFSGLYGQNFDDSRGLICGGEWSMPIVTSAWETYERQNANYLNTFNRQIENMKIGQKVQREQEIWNLIAGTLQGGLSGGAAGLLTFGGVGAGVGAGIGAGFSLAGGLRDRYLNEILRNEAIEYSTDQFGYQLGNIQALPNSLARTSAFTVNNKIFPFLEFYTCTDEEKMALAQKIANNGMTLMRIGKIKDYIDNTWKYNEVIARNYIKAKIIKCEGLEDEYHIANTISKELNKGIYFGGE